MKNNFLRKIIWIIPIALIAFFLYMAFVYSAAELPGKPLYAQHCASCHGENGEGVQLLIPPIANSDFAIKNFDSIPCWIKKGMSHAIVVNGKTFEQPMYPINIDEIQITNILDFIQKEMLKKEKTIDVNWTNKQLENCR